MEIGGADEDEDVNKKVCKQRGGVEWTAQKPSWGAQPSEKLSQLAWQYNTIPFVIFVNVYDVTTMIRRRHVTNKGIRS